VKIAALNNLSLAKRTAGEMDQALQLAEQALALCLEVGDRHREAALHNNLADLYHATDQPEQAMAHLKKAVTIYADIGGNGSKWQPEIWKLTEW
jgi:tetratricopeptide (TPR) repeat protein